MYAWPSWWQHLLRGDIGQHGLSRFRDTSEMTDKACLRLRRRRSSCHAACFDSWRRLKILQDWLLMRIVESTLPN